MRRGHPLFAGRDERREIVPVINAATAARSATAKLLGVYIRVLSFVSGVRPGGETIVAHGLRGIDGRPRLGSAGSEPGDSSAIVRGNDSPLRCAAPGPKMVVMTDKALLPMPPKPASPARVGRLGGRPRLPGVLLQPGRAGQDLGACSAAARCCARWTPARGCGGRPRPCTPGGLGGVGEHLRGRAAAVRGLDGVVRPVRSRRCWPPCLRFGCCRPRPGAGDVDGGPPVPADGAAGGDRGVRPEVPVVAERGGGDVRGGDGAAGVVDCRHRQPCVLCDRPDSTAG